MRADRPIPGNPWPHDMVITIEDHALLLLTLLFVNHAWQLDAPGIPPLHPAPEIGGSHRPESATAEQWRERWQAAWEEAVTAAGEQPQPPADDSVIAEWMREWQERQPKRFTETWGDEGFDYDAYHAWDSSMRPERGAHPVEESPEWQALPSLIGAWERGLHTVVTLPFAEHWSVQGGADHLLVSTMTRADTSRYSAALSSFEKQQASS